MTWQRYRKKPVVIEAIQFDPRTVPDGVETYVRERTETLHGTRETRYAWRIPTLEGAMEVQPGDWIVRGVKGELYPVKPSIFEATYEKAEP